MVEDLLTRPGTGPDHKVAARTRAATALPARPGLEAPPDSDVDAAPVPEAVLGEVVPFGVFDAFTDGSRA